MQHKGTGATRLMTCVMVAGSSAAAIKIQRTLEGNRIPAAVGKSTTASGCVYTVSFPCLYRESAENILASHGLKHRTYL